GHVFGERPRERADFLDVKARVLAKHAARLGPEPLARAVDTLRSELVAEREGWAGARKDLSTLRSDLAALAQTHQEIVRERDRWQDRYHTLNGEATALREERERLRMDVQRLYDEEKKLRAGGEDQAAHLGRTYAEIERLNRLIREMESTRAWRLHQWWHRR